MTERCEVLVIGAALNGLAAALALGGRNASRPLDVIIVDAKDPDSFAAVQHDGRASAITQSSRRMFEALGIWEAMAPHGEPMKRIIATDASADAEARPVLLQFNDELAPSGFIFENRHLLRPLWDEVKASPAIRVIAPAAVEHYEFGPGLAEARLADGRSIRANLIVAADGRNSPARAAACIKHFGWAYGQSAIVTTVAIEHAHDSTAYEHFMGGGPFALLPLPGNFFSIVWTEKTDEAARLMGLADDVFLEEFTRRAGLQFGRIELAAPRASYPLALYLAESFSGPRLALVGDAAHVIHPMAGLGFNLGLRDAAALAECVAEAVSLGLDPGGGTVLEDYGRWRRFDTVTTALACDGLNRLFASDNPWLRMLRSTALRSINAAPALKKVFQLQAQSTSRLPRLMLGDPV